MCYVITFDVTSYKYPCTAGNLVTRLRVIDALTSMLYVVTYFMTCFMFVTCMKKKVVVYILFHNKIKKFKSGLLMKFKFHIFHILLLYFSDLPHFVFLSIFSFFHDF